MTEPETPLSRRDAERLLDAPAEHDHVLGRALSTAAGPAHTDELRREDATVAAFHTARLSPAPSRRSHFVSPTRLGSRAAAQALVATAAVVALASGGFALSGSIQLPSLPGQASDRATESVAEAPQPTPTSSEAPTTTAPAGSPGTAGSDSPEADPTEAEATDAAPTPSFMGLCTAFLASDHSAHGSSLDSAAFTALATEAKGAANIETYCVALVGEPTRTGKPTELPTPTSRPTDRPTGKPSVLPTPTTRPTPTHKPTDKPSPGKPTDKPDHSGKGGGKDSSTTGS
jgi:hypothetical protein